MNPLTSFLVLLTSTFTRFLPSMPTHAQDDADRRWIAWSDGSDTESGFRIDVTVNGIDLNVPIDTGSTGFLISAVQLGYKNDSELERKHYDPAFEYLSSSRRYYEGYWLPSDLTFTTTNTGEKIHSRVPVLAVTEAGKCSSFTDGNCTKTIVRVMPDGIKYMGVGFGRWSTEQPDGTVDKNPFLNVDFGEDDTIRSGYVISDQGVILGVRTEDLTGDQDWKFTSLTPNNDAPPGPRTEWRGTPMCAQVSASSNGGSNVSECFHGTALFDTGINQTYLGVPPSATEDLKISHDGGKTYILQDGTTVSVHIGVPGNLAVSYSYAVGDRSNKLTPERVQLVREHSDGAFINTGLHFYNGFDLMFDEKSGVVGLRAKRDMSQQQQQRQNTTSMVDTKMEVAVLQDEERFRTAAELKL